MKSSYKQSEILQGAFHVFAALFILFSFPLGVMAQDPGARRKEPIVAPESPRSKQPQKTRSADKRQKALQIFKMLIASKFGPAYSELTRLKRKNEFRLIQEEFFALLPSPSDIKSIEKALSRERPERQALIREWLTGKKNAPIPAKRKDQRLPDLDFLTPKRQKRNPRAKLY